MPRRPKQRRPSRHDDEHRWKLSLLRAYLRKHDWGDLKRGTVVPPGVDLWTWANGRRQAYRKGTIADWLVAELNALEGWRWRPIEERQREIVDAVRAFVRRHRWEAITAQTVVAEMEIMNWLSLRRKEYRRGKLSPWLTRALAAIPGWTWQPQEARGDAHLRALREHVARHGWRDFRQTTRARTGHHIGKWVSHARSRYHRGKLPDELIRALERIPGWTWDRTQAMEERNLRLLRAYARRHGVAAIRRSTVVLGVQLGAWYLRCGERLRSGALPERLRLALAELDPDKFARRRRRR